VHPRLWRGLNGRRSTRHHPRRPRSDWHSAPNGSFSNLASQIPSVGVTDLARATASAGGVCAGLHAAASTENTAGLTPAQAAAGVNAAISAYCPQHMLSSRCERATNSALVPPKETAVFSNGRRGSLTRQPHVWHRSQSKTRRVTARAERKPLPCSPASPPTPAPWLPPSWC
jgi:Protein of unknown function (DUF732)